ARASRHRRARRESPYRTRDARHGRLQARGHRRDPANPGRNVESAPVARACGTPPSADRAIDEGFVMSGDEFDNKHGDLLRDYNAPPPAPVDAMWHDIEVARSGKRPVRTVRPAWLRPTVYAAAAAVVLALGIVIGQRNNRPAPVAPVATAPAVNSNTAYRIAALEHFTRAEAFLTRFEQESPGTDTDAAV